MGTRYTLIVDGTTYEVEINGDTVTVAGRAFAVSVDGQSVHVNGASYTVEIGSGQAVVDGIAHTVQQVEAEQAETGNGAKTAGRAARPSDSAGAVKAIMPGKVLRVLVQQGQTVSEGDVLLILEAMKMENELRAPKSGAVKALHARNGLDVEMGQVLAEIE